MEGLTFNPDTIKEDAINEAVRTLGLLSDASKARLLPALDNCMRLGFRAVATGLRKHGDQLSKDEKKQLGIRSNSFMSREAATELTERGRTQPLNAHFVTLWRADFTVSRAKTILAALEQNLLLSCQIVHKDGCEICEADMGIEISPFGLCPSPPRNCKNDGCNRLYGLTLDWTTIIREKAEEREKKKSFWSWPFKSR